MAWRQICENPPLFLADLREGLVRGCYEAAKQPSAAPRAMTHLIGILVEVGTNARRSFSTVRAGVPQSWGTVSEL